MKKITLITLTLIFCIPFLANSQQISETEFVAAKAQIAHSYKTLENSGLQLSLTFEQEASEMTAQEQAAMLALRGDLELGMFIVKENLALYTLQSVQVSTPPEAKKILMDSCLDTLDFLNGIQERLKVRSEIVNNKARNIVGEGISAIDKAKESINILQEFTKKL